MARTNGTASRRRAAIAIVVVSLGAVVGVASLALAKDERAAIDHTMSIELHLTGCATDDDDPATGCHVYPLRDDSGRRSGTVAKFREPIMDADGNLVGRQFAECIGSDGAGEICTLVEVLREGPYTDPGTIVLTGRSNGTLAVTGGSGAYANARGDATLGGGFVLTIDLLP